MSMFADFSGKVREIDSNTVLNPATPAAFVSAVAGHLRPEERSMRVLQLFAATAAILCFTAPACTQDASEFLSKAQKAALAGKTDEALNFANQAVAGDPKDTKCLAFRANLFSRLDRNKEALTDYSKLIALSPKEAQ